MEELIKKFLKNNPIYGSSYNKIGEGYNGKVFETDKGFIVKITRDKQEMQTSDKIMNKLNGVFTPKYHLIQSLEGNYVIVMDKIEPLNLSLEENNLLNLFRDQILKLVKKGGDLSNIKLAVEKNIPNKKMKFILSGIIDAVDGLKQIGIINADIQEDNIGVDKNGKIVMFDVVDELSLVESLRKIIRKIILEFSFKN